jgi:hypothetical protein
MSCHGAPVRSTQKMPLRTRRFFFGLTPRRLVGCSGSMTLHSKSVSAEHREDCGSHWMEGDGQPG